MPSKLFSFKYLFIIISVFVLSKSKMKDPPIKLWDKTLSEYFSTHDISNYINIEPKICLNNESYYLFVMQTILKFPDTKEEVETLGYTGFCLKEYNFTPVEHSLINYYYIWDTSNMNSSSLIEIKKLNLKNEYLEDKNNIKLKFFGALIIIYLFFVITVTIFPKKIDDKYNLKEYERLKKEREEDNNSDNNIDNINNDDNDNYNFKIRNEEDKPPADIINGLDSNNNYNNFDISENISNYNRYSETNDENKKEKNPLIKEINIYNELFLNKKNKDRLWNSFNIFQNTKILCEFSSLRKLKQDFVQAVRVFNTSRRSVLPTVCIEGCCYGNDNRTYDDSNHEKVCGEKFWSLISGEDTLFVDVIEPLGYKAKEKNDAYAQEYAQMINKFTGEFIKEYCDADGKINWEKIVRLNAAIKKQGRR